MALNDLERALIAEVRALTAEIKAMNAALSGIVWTDSSGKRYVRIMVHDPLRVVLPEAPPTKVQSVP